jgi:hypothetical protein
LGASRLVIELWRLVATDGLGGPTGRATPRSVVIAATERSVQAEVID